MKEVQNDNVFHHIEEQTFYSFKHSKISMFEIGN
uniref:Uncharacterized protein n=1 Tax=Arundo donax TaxID=35708 RepID=A0A0A8ZLG7_ARUDO